jgi:hypothetical protein
MKTMLFVGAEQQTLAMKSKRFQSKIAGPLGLAV